MYGLKFFSEDIALFFRQKTNNGSFELILVSARLN